MSTNYLSKEINDIKLKLTESSLTSMPKRQKKLKNESTSSSSEAKPQRSYSTHKGESSFLSELKTTFGLSTSLIRKKKSIKGFNQKNHNYQQLQPLQQIQQMQQQQQNKQLTISDLKKQFLKIFNSKPINGKKTTYRVKKNKCKQNQQSLNHNNNSNSININSNSNNHTTLSTDYTLSTLPQVSIDLNCTKDLSVDEVRELTNKLKKLSANQLKHIKYSYIKELKNLHKIIDSKINMDKSLNYE